MKKISGVILGLAILILGILIGLNTLNIINFTSFFKGWWTLFIIIPSISFLITSKDKAISLIFLLMGLLLFLASISIIDFSVVYKLTLPVVLIAVGLSFIYSYYFDSNKKEREFNEVAAVFGKEVYKVTKKFDGNYTNSIFGELIFDLSEAHINKDIVIESTSIFGKSVFILPNNVNVIIKSNNIFGKSNNNRKNKSSNNNTVFIHAKNIFGGVEIL